MAELLGQVDIQEGTAELEMDAFSDVEEELEGNERNNEINLDEFFDFDSYDASFGAVPTQITTSEGLDIDATAAFSVLEDILGAWIVASLLAIIISLTVQAISVNYIEILFN